MAKMYNGINGQELKTIVLKEVEQRLQLDPRFAREVPITKALMTWTAHIEYYPEGQHPFDVQISQLFKPAAEQTLSPSRLCVLMLAELDKQLSADLRFGLNLTYPNITCNHLLNLELTRPDGGTVERPVVEASRQTGTVDASRRIDLTEPPRILAVAEPSPLSERERRVQELRRELAGLEGETLASDPVSTRLSASETRHHDIDMFTGSGLPIEAQFKPSPGAAMASSWGGGAAVGAVQTREVVERLAVGVTHPSLADGGMGAPDAIRRENGLFVPETQVVQGQMVDIPAGTF